MAGHPHQGRNKGRQKEKDKLILVKCGGNIMKTFMASPATTDRKWYVVDATNMT